MKLNNLANSFSFFQPETEVKVKMAPKAKAPPKRTEADVIAEYELIRQEFDERAAAIKVRLEQANKTLLATRLEYVAARDNRVFLEAKLLAEQMSAEELAGAIAAASKETNNEIKKTIKNNQFELSYAVQASQSLARELESYVAQLQGLEQMRTTNVTDMETEMDRLAQCTSAFVSKSHRLQRTIAAIEATMVNEPHSGNSTSIADIDDDESSSHLRSPLQLTLLCGTDTDTAADGSALNPRCVMMRVEDVLTRRCGFHVFSKIVPEPSIIGSLLVTPTTERDLQHRISNVLWSVSQQFAAPTVTPLVVIHCPTWTDATGPTARLMLRFSNVSDEVARFLLESGQEGRREFFDIPLDFVLSLLISRSRNPNLMVLIDTWAVQNRPNQQQEPSQAEALPFALIYSKSVSDAPFVFRYTSSGPAVDAVHQQGGALQRVTRGVLLEAFLATVAACASPSQLDCHTVTAALVALMTSRHSALTVHRMQPSAAVGTPFAVLFVPVEKLKEMHHHVVAHQRPFPSPAALHYERREALRRDVPSATQRHVDCSASRGIPPSALKWKHLVDSSLSFRGSSDAARYPLRTQVATPDLLKLHVKKEANVPHAAFELDLAVEDDSYHTREKVEDDGKEWAQIVSRRLYSACVTLDESYVMEQRLNEGASIPIAIGQENWGGSSFSVSVIPPAINDVNDTSSISTPHDDIWHIDGVRLGSEKMLRLEVALVLDAKKGAPQGPISDSYERVTAALDPLAHSIKRKLQELLEALDANRLPGALRVVYAVDVWRISPRDDDHFRANVSIGVVVHQREPLVSHVVHIRRTLIGLLRRYPAKPADAWIPCAEQTTLPQPTTSFFRCARLFHVLRRWRCAVLLHAQTPFHLQSPRCEYIGHLLRRIVIVHAGIGGSQSSTGPVMRLMDVRSAVPDPEDDSASFGPHLILNEVPEVQISAALTAAWRCGDRRLSNASATSPNQSPAAKTADPAAGVLSPARSLSAAFGTKQPSFDTLCVLCWCFPKPANSGAVDSEDDDTRGLGAPGLLSMYIHSAMQSFHNKLRPTGASGVASLVTCGYSYAPRAALANGEIAVDYRALEASFMNALLYVGRGLALPVTAIRRLPLDELAPNTDEDTGDEPVNAAPTAACDEAEETPYAEDETYRPLPNARLVKKSIHSYNPLGSLFSLPLSFWHSVRDACEGKLAAVPRATAGVSLVAVVLNSDGSQTSVHSLTDSVEPRAGDAGAREALDGIPPALRPQEVEGFVQSILCDNTTSSAPRNAASSPSVSDLPHAADGLDL
jgi:hypothetical protein